MMPLEYIAYFISPHGFGHAARACAVMEAISRWRVVKNAVPVCFEIFTTVPRWFFVESLQDTFYTYHSLATDIGMVQKNPLEEDLDATIERLQELVPYDRILVDGLTTELKANGCQIVLCDIAPVGIVAAQAAGLPAVLIENFTWDWIYQGYLEQEPRFEPFIHFFRDVFEHAEYHIQSEPICAPSKQANLLTSPIGRTPRTPRHVIRDKFSIPANRRAALVTAFQNKDDIPAYFESNEYFWVITGIEPAGSDRHHTQCSTNQVILPRQGGFYHPDLVNACDVVIGKAGYSTLAEAYLCDMPFIYLRREGFRETQILADFIRRESGGFEISQPDLLKDDWIERLNQLLAERPARQMKANGADQVAEFINTLTPAWR